ncbi:RNA polymerase sigma-70 factor, ECF subfamily [Actinomadura glauciflava]|nr:RNA polymerase sigma-70 factor, ECF subfamily [Actinomadura glauciflava]
MAAMRQDFLDFFDAEFHFVVRFVMRDGAGLHDAQDAVQHGFLQGWRMVREGTWEQVRDPRAWIRTVALRHHRGQRRMEVPVQQLPEAATTGSGHAESTEQARDLIAALRLLDADARAVLAFHLDDIPTHTIAGQLNISEQKARDLLKKARRTLKKHLPAPPQRSAGPVSDTTTAGNEGGRQR